MANIVSIKNVYLYSGFTVDAKECYDVWKEFNTRNIKFTHLHYNNELEANKTFDPLGTWNWHNGTDYYQRTFDKFPICHWEVTYDNALSAVECAVGYDGILNSSLFANLDKIVES